jgi:uncharacterized protein (DUF3084 family)
MKRKHLQILVIALVIIIGAIFSVYLYIQKEAEIKSLMGERTGLNEQILQKDSVMNDFINTFNEIESNLDFVRNKRSQLMVNKEVESSKDRKAQMLEDISLMNTMLDESSKKIATLEKDLKKSGINLGAFKKRIAELNKSIESQNNEITGLKQLVEDKDLQMAELNEQIEILHSEVIRQADSMEVQQMLIDDKISKLNEGHIAFGTYKELKDKGLLTKEGGFLGLGASKDVQENFDDDYFMNVDIRDTQIIPLHTKKATVISEHPGNSYSLVKEDGQIAYLHIDNPDEFWKISKYAIIETK